MSRGGGNMLRIVGGKWRSRRLRFADAEGLRPTPDRVRETLFNWLQLEIGGAVCLDAFAGSGALGFEALSRGAARVVMVERQRPQFLQLKASAEALGAEGLELQQGDVLELLRKPAAWQPAEGFDGVFLDPPFHRSLLPEVCEVLLARGLLKPGAFVYIESESDWTTLALPLSFVLHKNTRAGLVQAFLARFEPESNS